MLSLFEEDAAVWLVEPRRTKSVRKFSGTLVHPNRIDKLGKTVSAFSHFSYEYSGNEIVLVDIQGLSQSSAAEINIETKFAGSPMTIRGIDTLILFDPMSHSQQSCVDIISIIFIYLILYAGTLGSVTMGLTVLRCSLLNTIATIFAMPSNL